MHALDIFDQAIDAAETLGYRIRQEWLGGVGGGGCEFGGQKWIFIDLTLTVPEQLDQIVETLKADPGCYSLSMSPELGRLLGLTRAA